MRLYVIRVIKFIQPNPTKGKRITYQSGAGGFSLSSNRDEKIKKQ